MKNFVLEEFVTDLEHKLSRIDFKSKSTCVNDNVNNLITVFKGVLNHHAPLRAMSRSEKRLSDQPRISKGILKSIKTNNRLFRSYYKSNDSNKKAVYKKYFNKLTHIKFQARRNYYKNLKKLRLNSHTSFEFQTRNYIMCLITSLYRD